MDRDEAIRILEMALDWAYGVEGSHKGYRKARAGARLAFDLLSSPCACGGEEPLAVVNILPGQHLAITKDGKVCYVTSFGATVIVLPRGKP